MGHDCVKQADFGADFGGQMFTQSGTQIPYAKMFETDPSYTKTHSYNL